MIRIDCFTDPLCSWSWACEPPLRRLRHELGPHLDWRLWMGGMVPDWSSYQDPLNSIAGPAQVGPHWMHVEATSGMPVDARLWHTDPPGSSMPACLAVKAAGLQGAQEAMLRRIREAVMLEGRNVARADVLRELAGEAGLDAERWDADFRSTEAAAALREDLREARYRGFGRFPTLVVRSAGESRGWVTVGYRPYEALLEVIEAVAPGIPRRDPPPHVRAYLEAWGSLVPAELAAAFDRSISWAVERLREEESAGRARRAFAGEGPARTRWALA